jgi:hypothetical protein
MVKLEPEVSKRARHSNAKLSHPNRAERERHTHIQKPQGRKCKHVTHDAIYHNWHSPFLWSQIVAAAKDPAVGESMSARAIAKVLMKKNPQDFGSISRNTIAGWIDCSGVRIGPNWR